MIRVVGKCKIPVCMDKRANQNRSFSTSPPHFSSSCKSPAVTVISNYNLLCGCYHFGFKKIFEIFPKWRNKVVNHIPDICEKVSNCLKSGTNTVSDSNEEVFYTRPDFIP